MENDQILHKNSLDKHIPVSEGSVILIDKPIDWTSFDVVNKIRFAIKHAFGLKKIKVGHAGTLDPLATGLLILCTGSFTKKINDIQNQHKTYSGHIQLGAVTPTYDSESAPQNHKLVPEITNEILDQIISVFTGEIQQVPPIYSAIKIKGQKAYDLARRGQDAELQPRSIHIFSLVLNLQPENVLSFSVSCSKGTYIRSLAHDIGEFLGCGAYLSSLRRDAIENYQVKDALSVDEAVDYIRCQANG